MRGFYIYPDNAGTFYIARFPEDVFDCCIQGSTLAECFEYATKHKLMILNDYHYQYYTECQQIADNVLPAITRLQANFLNH